MRPRARWLTERLRLRAKLGLLAATVTFAVLASTAWLTLRVFRTHLVEVLAEASSNHSDALRVLLEEQMTSSDLPHLRRIVADVGREPDVVWVGILNPQGRVRVTSDPALLDVVVDKASPDCRVCHVEDASRRPRSVTLLRQAGRVLRTTTPLVNGPECHRCHGEEARLNGMLVVDRSLAPLERTVASSRVQVALGTAAAVLALLATLGFAVERLVLTRLRRLREAARELGRGNLEARAPDASRDELGELARQFNATADALAGVLDRLAAERRQLEELVNGISDGVALVDMGLKLVTANRAFRQRLPADLDAVPGARWSELARAAGFSSADGVQSLAERALATDAGQRDIVRRADAGGERTEELQAQLLRDEGGRAFGVVEVWRDVTDRLELEAGLEQSERLAAIGMLASGVAHEVGNPLAAIATAVEGLLRRMGGEGAADAAELREYLEIVRRQVFRCREVTDRLLGFARVPARELATVDAAAGAREVLALVAPQAHAQGIEIRATLGAPAFALAETLLVEQVMLNLVLNALQAMPGGGVLRVEVAEAGEEVSIAVADTGPGISDAARKRLFAPFSRGRPDGGGTGLGLFLSSTLLRRCDGRISVESEPGKGTVFTVHLRRATGAAADAPTGAVPSRDAGASTRP
ncbi:MAG TPA: ATP-binding protein [Anaeromyxobacter sp.]|nr:ATP-binding protein [Anaeromyxobacter sp.]